jgi:hypothetical protein
MAISRILLMLPFLIPLVSCYMMNKREVYNKEPVCIEKRRACSEYESSLKLSKKMNETIHLRNLRENCESYTASCAEMVNKTW